MQNFMRGPTPPHRGDPDRGQRSQPRRHPLCHRRARRSDPRDLRPECSKVSCEQAARRCVSNQRAQSGSLAHRAGRVRPVGPSGARGGQLLGGFDRLCRGPDSGSEAPEEARQEAGVGAGHQPGQSSGSDHASGGEHSLRPQLDGRVLGACDPLGCGSIYGIASQGLAWSLGEGRRCTSSLRTDRGTHWLSRTVLQEGGEAEDRPRFRRVLLGGTNGRRYRLKFAPLLLNSVT
jgi:hypothetical protein